MRYAWLTGEEIVPEEWSGKGVQMTLDEWGVREYKSGFKSGCTQGLTMAVIKIRQLAQQAFIDKHDEKARWLRELADEIQRDA